MNHGSGKSRTGMKSKSGGKHVKRRKPRSRGSSKSRMPTKPKK